MRGASLCSFISLARAAIFVEEVALRAPSLGLEATDSISLLQLKAKPVELKAQQVSTLDYNSSSTLSGHAFGCTGRSRAEDHISCGLWGDVHQHMLYGGGGGADVDGTGWFWLAKSKDDSFQAHAFYRQLTPDVSGRHGSGWTAMTHFAFKFGENRVILNRDRQDNWGWWRWQYIINGEQQDPGNTPMEIGPLYWINGQKGMPVSGSAKGDRKDHIHANEMGHSWRLSCFESGKVSIWTNLQSYAEYKLGPFMEPAAFEVEGARDFLDESFGQCAGLRQKVAPQDMLVTTEQNQQICRDNKLTYDQCEHPPPPSPPPTKEEMCQRNNVEFSHAEDLCADQQAHSSDIYEGCLYDVCASIDADAQLLAVGGAELESALMNPQAKCTLHPDSCLPCKICTSSTKVDLSNVVQNNLGGLGPDGGAEEIRYKNAIDLDGRMLDVVLTAVDEYRTPKAEKNGKTGAGFGSLTLATKSSTNFKFSFVDATTGEAATVKDLALTFYDLDQGKNDKQQEIVTACNAGEVYTTSDTELEVSTSGSCRSFSSSERGSGKDNPQQPNELTKTQAARSVTFEFHARASISFGAAVGEWGKNARPVLFSFEPQVACGASDAEQQCN